MKRFGEGGERTTASDLNAVNFFDGTSFLSGGVPGHASGTRRDTGGVPGQTRRTSGHKDRIPDVARRAPDHARRTSYLTGGVPSQTRWTPGVFRRTPAVKRCAPDGARCVSGVSGDVSGVDRCMEIKDLCNFIPFTSFPFGAVKQNTEKQQTTIETNKQTLKIKNN